MDDKTYQEVWGAYIKKPIKEEMLDALCVEHFFRSLTRDGKPSWDTYFLNMAKLAATRSIDPSTKCGCVIVDNQYRVLSLGYNGPIQGIDDSLVPLTRPSKYSWFGHAEEHAILFCKAETNGGTAYITGRPCARCTRMLLQKGIARIICGNQLAKCVDEDDAKASTTMLAAKNVPLAFREQHGSIYLDGKNHPQNA